MGLKDSVIPDVRNTRTGETFDYKFGEARVTDRQRKKYAVQLPRNSDGAPATTLEVKPNIK